MMNESNHAANGLHVEGPLDIEKSELVHEGKVKDVLSVPGTEEPVNILRYSPACTIPYYGRMPFKIEGSNEAKAMMAGYIFERMADPATWKDLIGSRVWNSIPDDNFRNKLQSSSALKTFAQKGLQSHYLGMVTPNGDIKNIDQLASPTDMIAVEGFDIIKPIIREAVWGHDRGVSLFDYKKQGPMRYIVPIKTIFRIMMDEENSFNGRLNQTDYLESIGVKRVPLAGDPFERPILEHMTMLEPFNRYLSLTEAYHYSGMNIKQTNDRDEYALLQAMWLLHFFGEAGISVTDGKLEFGIDKHEYVRPVEGITIDNIRTKREGFPLGQRLVARWYEENNISFLEAISKARAESRDKGRDTREIIKEMEVTPKIPGDGLLGPIRDVYSAVNQAMGVPLYNNSGGPNLEEAVARSKQYFEAHHEE